MHFHALLAVKRFKSTQSSLFRSTMMGIPQRIPGGGLRVGENFWYDFGTGDLSKYIEGMPNPEYCPFCSYPLPKMVRKEPPPPHICRVTDGGYYCDTCKQRLNECICDPPGAAFEQYIEPPATTVPNNLPPFENESDEPR